MEKDMRFEMMKVLKGRQDRLIYYIAGLNVAAIGFTLSKTFDIPLNQWIDIFLAIALICWIVSTSASFRWIFTQFRVMESNLEVKDLIDGSYDKSKISETDKNNRIEKTILQLGKDASRCERAIKTMFIFFITGIVSFIGWRLLYVFYAS